MKILNRIKNGLSCVLLFCAMWVGSMITCAVFINKDTSWSIKIIMLILILIAFVFGYFEKEKD